ncbi:uncharacterized protein KQ657_002024 [Scheffersomyces spartinae]|uniref:Uncharacterized protein n=1 Tax=Scheffersomyces spartinae TaxID=45513 RepID=A0A9P7V6K0_9ASCO|nr:uncharacterized protein KQ657_002024 [Scheffersomyces spartinae]KAG7192305.1 hypothetical protein KQ657_002024 [Scheffersomyces spartinae]
MSVVMVSPGLDQNQFSSEEINNTAVEDLPQVQVQSSQSQSLDVNLKVSKHFSPNDFIDIPLLIPDHEGLTDEDEDDVSYRNNSSSIPPGTSQVTSTQTSFQSSFPLAETYATNSFRHRINKSSGHHHHKNLSRTLLRDRIVSSSLSSTPSTATATAKYPRLNSRSSLTPLVFLQERTKLMAIIVKYIATKIENSFPPDSSGGINKDELELDKVMLLLVARLGLGLPLFLKLIIYLFRYMDIVYLLRYLNQLNNMANYQLMDFGLKQLIIGCFKLTVEMERQEEIKLGVTDMVIGIQGMAGRIYTKDWEAITGFTMTEIDVIALTISKRLNGKLTIKTMELLKLKSEIFRFVRMVSTTV